MGTEDVELPPVYTSLYRELAPALSSEEHRQLLRALLDASSQGGGSAVAEEIKSRLATIRIEEL
jgi:hypothetical protein